MSDEEEDEMYFGIKNPAQEESKKIEINQNIDQEVLEPF